MDPITKMKNETEKNMTTKIESINADMKKHNLTTKERLAVIYKDPSMRDPRWKELVSRWVTTDWKQMTQVMKDGTVELLNA